MNLDNLHELINRYEEDLNTIYNDEHDELFKWRGMKTWQEEWFKPADAFASFADRFTAAKRDFMLFTDNSRMHPSSGVVKLWEKEPKTVEHLFYNVLFRDPEGSVASVHDNMEAFLEGYEELRIMYFPRNWSFKQDRHSASVYLSMLDPGFNYAFKSSEASLLSKYIGFGYPIGAGSTFSLENYYKLGDEVVMALREHKRLLDKHFDMLDDRCFVDESLHLLAFDVMYCSRAYNYYKGLVAPEQKSKVRKRSVSGEISAEEIARREAERIAQIESIEQEILELEKNCDGCEDISLIGVEVTSDKYGAGTVIAQEINKITVAFPASEKPVTFKLDKKYSNRPRFENDEDIVESFTVYGRAQERIELLRKKLKRLQ